MLTLSENVSCMSVMTWGRVRVTWSCGAEEQTTRSEEKPETEHAQVDGVSWSSNCCDSSMSPVPTVGQPRTENMEEDIGLVAQIVG